MSPEQASGQKSNHQETEEVKKRKPLNTGLGYQTWPDVLRYSNHTHQYLLLN